MVTQLFTRKEAIGKAIRYITVTGGLLMFEACAEMSQRDIESDMAYEPAIEKDELAILKYASLAPSSHNMQPWIVVRTKPYEYVIGSDKKFWLPAVDSKNHETIISIGAFVENFVTSASALGYKAKVTIIGKTVSDKDLVNIRLTKSEASGYPLDRIRLRRKVKKGYANAELMPADVRCLTGVWQDHILYFPRNTAQAAWIGEAQLEAFREQSFRDAAQREFAECVRFTDDQIKKHMDGLTARTMELGGVAGWYMSRFMNSRDVLKPTWRDAGIDSVAHEVQEGAGWMIVTAKDHSVANLIETGRRFERMALLCREKKIAIHPMSQILEEGKSYSEILQKHQRDTVVHMVVRTGYINSYPNPVSMRRPVKWFLKIV